MAKIRVDKKPSIITETLNTVKNSINLKDENYFLFSFRHLDRNQGDNFQKWEQSGELARAIETLSGLCNDTISNQQNKKFTIYKCFPPKDKTEYVYPSYIQEDAKWARIHITGKQCIIGHIVKNIFYIVFLDGEHKFWRSELKYT